MVRFYLIIIIYLVILSGCVNNPETNRNLESLNASLLVKHQQYSLNIARRNPVSTNHWWARFNDPLLNQLLKEALENSPTVQIAAERVDKAKKIANEVGSALWPSLNLNATVVRQRFSQFGLAPPPFNGRTFNIGQVGLNFNYEIDFWNKNRQALAAKVSEHYAAKADLDAARLIISTAVANTYFLLKKNLYQYHLAQEALIQRQKMVTIIKYRVKHGLDSDIPLENVLADIQQYQLQLEFYRQAETMSRHKLAMLMGKNPLTTDIVVDGFVYKKYYVNLPSNIPANVLAKRPDIAASRLRIESAAHEINVAKARFFPNINLMALFSYQSLGLGHLFDVQSQNNYGGPAIDLPIFDAGARRANLGVKNAEYDIALSSYNQTILTALREVADQAIILNSLNSQVLAQTHELRAIEENYKLIYARYTHGITGYTSVLQSKDAVLKQRSKQVEYQGRQLIALVDMIKALGGD